MPNQARELASDVGARSPGTASAAYGPELSTVSVSPRRPRSGTKSSLLHSERTIGRYRLVRELGSGGFGTVSLAWDTQLERLVAIKQPKQEITRRPDSLEQLLSRRTQRGPVASRNIVALHDFGEHDGIPYLVYEFVDGETIGQPLRRKHPTQIESAQLVAEIAQALDYAHSRGVVHRDVKCENIMIDRRGRAA